MDFKLIKVIAKPNSRTDNLCLSSEDNVYVANVRAKAIEGSANRSIITLLSENFNLPKNRILLKTGAKSRIKIFKIYQ